MLTNHWTPLISHTAVDILTTLTGTYGDKTGIPIGNSLRDFNPNGTSTAAGSFAYWTDPLNAFTSNPTDTTPQMIDQHGVAHPAPWVAFTRAGCDVGAFATANIELENTGLDITTVFGANSPEAAEAKANPPKAVADFEGIAIHCAKTSTLCATGKPDLLPDEPQGYVGFQALFGNKYVQPQISSGVRSRISTATSSKTAMVMSASQASRPPHLRPWAISRPCSRIASRWCTAISPTRMTTMSMMSLSVRDNPATSRNSRLTMMRSANSLRASRPMDLQQAIRSS